MTEPPYTLPAINKTAFNCPHCQAFSRQLWGLPNAEMIGNAIPGSARGVTGNRATKDCWITFCDHCHNMTIWIASRMVYPGSVGGVTPNPDMPSDIMGDFEEARSIVALSTRGAAALLRVCIEKLCKSVLGDESKDINADIKLLMQRGLPVGVQRALDTVRVVGNECVHAGQLDFRDDEETANKLFGLVNFIVEDRITRPKEIAALYERLPAAKLEGIEKRDAPKGTKSR